MSQALSDNTDKLVVFGAIAKSNTGTGASSLTAELHEYMYRLHAAQNATHLVQVFSHCSDDTGGYVQMRPEEQYVPVLIGTKNDVIPLYHFVEVLDEVLDYDLIIKELPSLTYSHVGGAISFLRSISQVNPKGIELDALEDQQLSEDPIFLEEIRKALADKEISRVLNRD